MAGLTDLPRAGRADRGDLAVLAQGGILNLAGGAATALATFALAIVLARRLGPAGAGGVIEAIALFAIATGVALFGADVGMVRTVAHLTAHGRARDVGRVVRAALGPVLIVAVAITVAAVAKSEEIARLVARAGDREAIETAVRVLAPFLPVAAVFNLLVSATQGYGTMVPAVVVDKVAKPVTQTVLFAITAGFGSAALALSWGLPIVAGLIAISIWLVALAGRVPDSGQSTVGPPSPRAFWRFAAPRGVGGICGVTILWLDTILLGALRSTREAGIYSIATRYTVIGNLAVTALIQVVAPRVSALLGAGKHERARDVFRTATWWGMLLTWPIYLMLAGFAPLLTRAIGTSFSAGTGALQILVIGILFSTGSGPVDVVLLMGGRSGLSLMNWVAALSVNVTLNLILIPRYGMTGAAVTWAATIVTRNALSLIQVYRTMGMTPFGRSYALALAAPISTFGTVAILARVTGTADSAAAMGIAAIVAGGLYVLLVRRWRTALHLEDFGSLLRARMTPQAGVTGVTPGVTPGGAGDASR